MTPSTERTAAIYTSFYPSSGFRERIRDVVNACSITIVVDNTPGGFAFSPEDIAGIILLQDGKNKGLGAAINIGINEALRHDCNIAVLFDQDSSPTPDFIEKLFDGLSISGSRAIIGPKLVDDKNLSNSSDLAPSKSCAVGRKVTCIATSGMCFRLDALQSNDRFTEVFFLDFVDFDWCWRMREKGWQIYQLSSLQMPHRLGLEQRKFLGITYHIPAPFRHYFQFRDTLKLLTYSFVPTYSKFRLGLILLPKIIIYPFMMDSGFKRFRWMLLGIVDAFKGVSGAGSASEILK